MACSIRKKNTTIDIYRTRVPNKYVEMAKYTNYSNKNGVILEHGIFNSFCHINLNLLFGKKDYSFM